MLKLVLPKGSLEKATLELFESADLAVSRSSNVEYKATIDDPRIDDVRILRPQEIPRYVAEGMFDLGITGRDWIEETSSDVESLGELRYSKATSRPIRMVVAVGGDSPWQRVEDLPDGVRVSTEYPEVTRRFFEEKGIEADIRLSYGATEAKIPDIVDCIVEITETGRALRAAGLREIDVILQSYTELIANRASFADPVKQHAMHQVRTLLEGTMEARGKVLVKLNVSGADLDAVIKLIPAMKKPTVAELYGGDGYAVETVVPKSDINTLIPALKDAGATDIIELPISKIVHWTSGIDRPTRRKRRRDRLRRSRRATARSPHETAPRTSSIAPPSRTAPAPSSWAQQSATTSSPAMVAAGKPATFARPEAYGCRSAVTVRMSRVPVPGAGDDGREVAVGAPAQQVGGTAIVAIDRHRVARADRTPQRQSRCHSPASRRR